MGEYKDLVEDSVSKVFRAIGFLSSFFKAYVYLKEPAGNAQPDHDDGTQEGDKNTSTGWWEWEWEWEDLNCREQEDEAEDEWVRSQAGRFYPRMRS
eukprot:scaffold144651_cov47-Attheya_sp.AAC.3